MHLPIRIGLLAVMFTLGNACVTGRLMEATAGTCERELLEQYLEPARAGGGNVSRERRVDAANRLCSSEPPEVLAREAPL